MLVLLTLVITFVRFAGSLRARLPMDPTPADLVGITDLPTLYAWVGVTDELRNVFYAQTGQMTNL